MITDLGWLNDVQVNLSGIKNRAATFQVSRPLENEYETAWLLRAITCIDLTTLAGDDTHSNVARLCYKVIIKIIIPVQVKINVLILG